MMMLSHKVSMLLRHRGLPFGTATGLNDTISLHSVDVMRQLFLNRAQSRRLQSIMSISRTLNCTLKIPKHHRPGDPGTDMPEGQAVQSG